MKTMEFRADVSEQVKLFEAKTICWNRVNQYIKQHNNIKVRNIKELEDYDPLSNLTSYRVIIEYEYKFKILQKLEELGYKLFYEDTDNNKITYRKSEDLPYSKDIDIDRKSLTVKDYSLYYKGLIKNKADIDEIEKSLSELKKEIEILRKI